MPEPIDHLYFNWLCAKAISITAENPFYRTLFKVLHETEFVWVVPGDRHRAEDGLELRRNFLVESGFDDDPYWRDLGCSVLEMLIAFSRRAWFQTEMDPKEWFWIFMRNLRLDEMSDSNDPDPQVISDILYTFIWRTYNFNGMGGGLFPIRKPTQDQKNLELWYQFFDYIEENYPMELSG